MPKIIDTNTLSEYLEENLDMAIANYKRNFNSQEIRTLEDHRYRLTKCYKRALYRKERKSKEKLVNCGLPFCPYCSNAVRLEAREKLEPYVDLASYPVFATFTFCECLSRSYQNSLLMAKRIFKSFLNRAVIKRQVKGSLYVLEADFNPESLEWKVHIHCILDIEPGAEKLLEEKWTHITGATENEIERTRRRFAVLKYCLKSNLAHIGLIKKDECTEKYKLTDSVLDSDLLGRILLSVKPSTRTEKKTQRSFEKFGSFRAKSKGLRRNQSGSIVIDTSGLLDLSTIDEPLMIEGKVNIAGHLWDYGDVVRVSPKFLRPTGVYTLNDHFLSGKFLSQRMRKQDYEDEFFSALFQFSSKGDIRMLNQVYWNHIPKHYYDVDESQSFNVIIGG